MSADSAAVLKSRTASARAPQALHAGSLVAVVAPSGPFDRAAFDRGVARLRERYRVHYSEDVYARRGYLAGDDTRRLNELRAALHEPAVAAIVAARGGYGATRLLEALDATEVSRAGKLLVGYSDVTALHALWARAGLRSVHGPMVAALGRADGPLFSRWVGVLEGAVPPQLSGLPSIAPGAAAGRLAGGNLAVLAALAGTPYAPPLAGAVLFLEDVGERPYRVDRMLTTLRHAGWFTQVAGIVLGMFTRSDPGPDGITIEEVLHERLGDLGIPVLTGVPAGHRRDNLELPLGACVRIDADRGTLEFLEAAVEREVRPYV